jgi:hypothetical protein
MDGSPLTYGDLVGGRSPRHPWPGERKDLQLPYLFLRANPGDTGTRPVTGVFWESPDILVAPGVAPSAAPARPTELGGQAQAGADNTVYAHVWNLGRAAADDVLVEFYWFNPTMGFNQAAANLIGVTWTSLGSRSSGRSHRLVKCPESWPAQYVNGGHECLLVRVSAAVTDPLASPEWDAALNRQIGQRNIHVMSASEAAASAGLQVGVGPLFGAAAHVQVQHHDTSTMPWLHLVTMDRASTLGAAAAPDGFGMVGATGGTATAATAVGDDAAVTFSPGAAAPGGGDANVFRLTATQGGTLVGGYTVVVVGD